MNTFFALFVLPSVILLQKCASSRCVPNDSLGNYNFPPVSDSVVHRENYSAFEDTLRVLSQQSILKDLATLPEIIERRNRTFDEKNENEEKTKNEELQVQNLDFDIFSGKNDEDTLTADQTKKLNSTELSSIKNESMSNTVRDLVVKNSIFTINSQSQRNTMSV